MAKIEDSERPWVSNYPALQNWLDKHQAICMWQQSSVTQSVECWQAGQAMFIVVVHAKRHGWDIFTPCLNTEIAATLADAEKRLGLV